MVSRLDGPSAAIARGLVDKAMEAETNGLWGRAYFDARGYTNGAYAQGDQWMRQAAQAAQIVGYEMELDDRPELLTHREKRVATVAADFGDGRKGETVLNGDALAGFVEGNG